MNPTVTEGKGGDAFSRNVGRRFKNPEDILPIDWREEEEGAQSALMNEEPQGPYPGFCALASRHPPSQRHPLPVGRFYGFADCRIL